MTPEARIAAGARRWLKIAVQEMATVANALEKDLTRVESDSPVIEKHIVSLRQQAKRCAYHGLGMTVQQLLPLIK